MLVISYNPGLGIDAAKHVGGRLVRRVLRHEFTLHSEVENFGFGSINFLQKNFFVNFKRSDKVGKSIYL